MDIIQPNLKFSSVFTINNIPDTVILHHAEASKCTVEDIHRWHLSNGWIGIGYHYFVDKQGQIFKGRPNNAQGAHCRGYNSHSIGVCAEGCYMTEAMPPVQMQSIVGLIKSLKIKKVFGHGEVYPTSCPGKNFPLARIKAEVLNISQVDYPGYYLCYNPRKYDANVVKVQQKLGIAADGYFGPMTKKAVQAFQRANKLDADGVIGPLTWAKMFKEG